jgi:hypothetical protein
MRTGSRSRGGTATAVPPRLLFVPRTPCRSGVTQAERDAGTHTDGWTSDEREELARLRRDNRRLSEEIEELLETQAHARVLGVLKNPSYARAYVHGRYPPPGRARRDGTVHTGLIETAPRLVARVNPKTTMRVTSPGRSFWPTKPSWRPTAPTPGPPPARDPRWSGHHRLRVLPQADAPQYRTDQRPSYECSSRADRLTTPTCRSVAESTVDDAVAERCEGGH